MDWGTLEVVRVEELPRAESAGPDPFGAQRFASLVSAYHSAFRAGPGRPVVWVWRRTEAGGPVRLLTVDPALLPPSTRAEPDGTLGGWLSGVRAWRRLAVRHEALADQAGNGNRTTGTAGPSIETALLGVWSGPFALAVVAEAVGHDDTDGALREAAGAAQHSRQRAESSPDQAIRYERARAWHRELHEASTTGLWRVQVLVGADAPEDAATVAALATASLELDGLPYVVAPAGQNSDEQGELAGTRLLTALCKPPLNEVPGIRLTVPPSFDVTPETQEGDGPEGSGVVLGSVLDQQRRKAEPLSLGMPSLNRHTFVCGATGAGKSFTVRHLLTEATAKGLPWLVIEPAKAEYARMAGRLPEHQVIVVRPGDPEQTPVGIDPLRPQPGFPLQTHLDLVRALFLAAFDADEPFPQVLAAALTKAYEQQGWDIALGTPAPRRQPPRYPTLADLERAALEIVDEIGYGREVADNVRGFVRVRLASLRLGTTGRFLEGGFPIDLGRLLQHNVVLEIEDIGDDRDKGFVIGVVLIALTEHLRAAERRGDPRRGQLRHLTVIEEAHRLLRRTEREGAAAQAVEMFAALLAEVRAYGEGLIIAEQIPAKLVPDVIKNTAVKVVHRLPAKDDRDAVGATMNLSDQQSSYVVTLSPGEAAVFADGMDQPVLVRVPDGTLLEASNDWSAGSPATLGDRRFGRCALNYGVGRRTARRWARLGRIMEQHPALRWWVELTVLAHLVGVQSPPATEPVLEAYARAERNDRRELVTLALDEALAVRSSVISRTVDLERFAEHVLSKLLLTASDGMPPCLSYEPDWVSRPFEWDPVSRTLRASDPSEPPHKYTGHWRRALGITVPGETIGEQLQWVERRRARNRDFYGEQHILFGDERPCWMEHRVGVGHGNPEWPTLLQDALEELTTHPLLWEYLCSYTAETE